MTRPSFFESMGVTLHLHALSDGGVFTMRWQDPDPPLPRVFGGAFRWQHRHRWSGERPLLADGIGTYTPRSGPSVEPQRKGTLETTL